MIDTIRFQIPLNDRFYEAIRAKSHELVKKDNFFLFEDKRWLDSSVTVKPFNTKVTVLVYDQTCAYVECSLPKVFYGHNVKLFYPSQLLSTVELIDDTLREYFGIFPSYLQWKIQRLDMCYAYKFATHHEALRILDFLSVLRYPRKSIHIYPRESVNWGGRTYNIKFYLKELEFRKKGMKELIDNGFIDEANNALELSKGVLRYEISFRKMKLNQVLGHLNRTKFTLEDISGNYLYIKTLNQHLEILLGGVNKRSLSYERAMDKLKITFNKDKPLRLFNFYTNHFSQDAYIRRLVRNNYNASNIKRNLSSLKEAGIGIPNDDNKVPFTLSIPNHKVVNTDPLFPLAGAGGNGLSSICNTAQTMHDIHQVK